MDISINSDQTEQDLQSDGTGSGKEEMGMATDVAELDTSLNTASSDMDSGDMASLMEMYEESFKRFAEGEVVKGRIISVDKDHVLVDIGYKSEGHIRIHEFKDEKGEINVKPGDAVEVMVEWWDDENEVVILSKEKAAKVKVWDEIKKAYENETAVEGLIINRVKGGFSVDIG
ncbi:MAG: S1 RNA-binding domain-containing protein, partial [Proteobacteria bacterium]|nr:S1 RNA-binding domain-containing protein [Pseudomonadota bacterium]